MKYIILTFLLFSLYQSNAQNQPHFSIGASNKPLISNYWSTTSDKSIPSFILNRESSLRGFAADLFVRYHLSNDSYLKFGIGYIKSGSELPKKKLIWGMPDPSEPTDAQIKYIHQDIKFPITFNWNVINKKHHRFFLSGGIYPTYNFSRKNQFTLWFADGSTTVSSTENTLFIRRINLNGSLGFGYEYLLTENFSVYIQPEIETNILNFNRSTPVKGHVVSYGIGLGLCYFISPKEKS